MIKLLFSLLLLLNACSNNKTDFTSADHTQWSQFPKPYIEPIEQGSRRMKIGEMVMEKVGFMDILWVVDNSGSMSTIHNNIVSNASIFMNEILKVPYLNWKMGVISSDQRDAPYLGFSTPFTRGSLDPVQTFASTISRLGTSGSPTEIFFDNVIRALEQFPNFLTRSDMAGFAVILVSDEAEQSRVFNTGKKFVDEMRKRLGARAFFKVYGAFDLPDMPFCRTNYGDYYRNSRYEEAINLTSGFAISACAPDFGRQLASIGGDIAVWSGLLRVTLEHRPKVETISVNYKGLILKAGWPEDGGHWYYDEEFNTLNFYNLDFIDDLETDEIEVNYDVEDGWQRN